MNIRFLALFATGFLAAYAIDKWRKSGLYGEQELFPLENSEYTFPDVSRPSIDYTRQQVLEQNSGLGGTLVHLS